MKVSGYSEDGSSNVEYVKAEFVDYNDNDGVWGNWSVHCPHCESDPMYKDERGDKWCVMIEVHGDSKETVEKAWNTRAERTCRIEGVSGGVSCESVSYRLSCGHVVYVPRGVRFKHCYECGAQVVKPTKKMK